MTLSSPWRELAPLVRRLGETRLGGAALRATYLAAARGAAVAFGRIPGVTAVLASGSITRLEMLAPGASDIDLLLVVDVPTTEAELALRRRITKVHGLLHGAIPLFSNLDYVEARDLDLLRAFGNAWSMDFDRRFECLWGHDPRRGQASVIPRPPEERSLEHAVFAVKSWLRACGVLLHPGTDPRKTAHQVERLVGNLLASALDQDRFVRRPELLREAGKRGTFPLASGLPPEGPLPLHAGLAAALESAINVVESVSENWQLPFNGGEPCASPVLTPEVRGFATLARREGLSPVLVPRGPAGGGHLAIAIAPPLDSPVEIVGRAARLFANVTPLSGAEFRWLDLPAVVPPSFIRAAALWGPAPLVAPALAGSALWLGGEPMEAPRRPPESELRSLLRARVLQQLVRRPARADRSPTAFAAELEFEAHSLRPALAQALDTGQFRLALPDLPPRDEGEEARVGALRKWSEERRDALTTELRARRGTEGEPG